MNLSILIALGTAVSVALSNLIAAEAVPRLGPFGFNRWRLSSAVAALLAAATLRGGWSTVSCSDLLPLFASGAVGIVVGDTAVYAAMERLGPRRAGLLYATSAPMSAVLGAVLLGEALPPVKWVGIALVVAGVCLAIAFRERDALHRWEAVRGSAAAGVGFGLLGGLGQASAALMARPAMAAGADPAAAACLRAAAALAGLVALSASPAFRAKGALDAGVARAAAMSGLLGMGLGMTLLLAALSVGPVGVVASAASTSPVVMLPLIWAASGRPPAPRAWLGAVLAVLGVSALLWRT